MAGMGCGTYAVSVAPGFLAGPGLTARFLKLIWQRYDGSRSNGRQVS